MYKGGHIHFTMTCKHVFFKTLNEAALRGSMNPNSKT